MKHFHFKWSSHYISHFITKGKIVVNNSEIIQSLLISHLSVEGSPMLLLHLRLLCSSHEMMFSHLRLLRPCHESFGWYEAREYNCCRENFPELLFYKWYNLTSGLDDFFCIMYWYSGSCFSFKRSQISKIKFL